MHDIEVAVPDGASGLAAIGRALGAAAVGLEGGGMWSGTAHYLVEDGAEAARALDDAGRGPVTVRPVVVAELDADVPGALGRLMDRLTAAGVGLRAQYSDHANRKVLVVDEPDRVRQLLDGGAGA